MPNHEAIRKELSKLKPVPPQYTFEYTVGNFYLQMFSNYNDIHDSIFKHETLDVVLFEWKPAIYDMAKFYINLEIDPRFKKYEPIKYGTWPGSSTGQNMPINYLVELISYLHWYPKLRAFM